MKSGTDDIARLRTLFAAERSANFPEFTDVYCVDAADDVLARFARARRGDPHAALQFLKEDYAWRKAEDAAKLRSTPPADVLGQSPEVLAEYYRRRCVGLDCQGRLTFYQAYACCVVRKLVAAVAAGVLLSKDAGAFTGTALLAAVLALPLTALGLRAVYRRDADAFVMYTFLQLGLVLALCFLSVASLTIAANGRVSATVRFHRASVGCACLVQLLTSSATTYSSFGVHALFAA